MDESELYESSHESIEKKKSDINCTRNRYKVAVYKIKSFIK